MPPTRLRLLLVLAAATALTRVLAGSTGDVLTLEEAIQQALAKNFVIRTESFGPRIAAARLLDARGAFDPTIRLSYQRAVDGASQPADPTSSGRPPSTVIKIDDYQASLGGRTAMGTTYALIGQVQNQRGTFNNFNDQFFSFGGVRVTQPLLRGFGFGPALVEVRIARANRTASEWQFKQTVIDTVTRVVQLYNDLWFAQENLKSARRSRDLALELLDENEKRVRIGAMAPADVTVARTRAARRDEGIIIAERILLDTQNFLRLFLSDSLRPDVDSPLAITPPEIPVVPILDKPGDLARAFDLRPDYQQAKAVVAGAKARLSSDRSELLPQVDFVGSLGYNGVGTSFSGSVRDARRSGTESWSAGAVVSLPIPLRSGRGRFYGSKYNLERAETDLLRIEQEIVVRVANAAGQIDATSRRVESTRRARHLAEESLRAELKRLEVGQTSTFNVLEFQEVLSGAEISEYRALADYNQAITEYERQIGTTLAARGVQLAARR